MYGSRLVSNIERGHAGIYVYDFVLCLKIVILYHLAHAEARTFIVLSLFIFSMFLRNAQKAFPSSPEAGKPLQRGMEPRKAVKKTRPVTTAAIPAPVLLPNLATAALAQS